MILSIIKNFKFKTLYFIFIIMSNKLERLDLPKFRLEDYEIKSTLGTGILNIIGTFTRVRLVKDKKNNQCYAIKIFKKSDIIKERLA